MGRGRGDEALSKSYSLTECTLDYDRCQVNWFTKYESLIEMITVQSLWPIIIRQVYEPRLEMATDVHSLSEYRSHMAYHNLACRCMSQSLNQYPMATNVHSVSEYRSRRRHIQQ